MLSDLRRMVCYFHIPIKFKNIRRHARYLDAVSVVRFAVYMFRTCAGSKIIFERRVANGIINFFFVSLKSYLRFLFVNFFSSSFSFLFSCEFLWCLKTVRTNLHYSSWSNAPAAGDAVDAGWRWHIWLPMSLESALATIGWLIKQFRRSWR